MDPKLLMPFHYGWKREVVYRYNSNAIDVYYRTPDNKKLRSRREVLEYLKPRSRLKIDNFTFARKPLGLDSSKEICRRAYSSKKVVNNHDSAAINKNKNEDQIMESDVEVENPNNLQSEVVNNHDGAAIDKNKTEEQTVELDIEEDSPINVKSCSKSTAETPESDESSLFETTMFYECNGRRFQFRKGSDEENQVTIAFINDIIMKNHNTTRFYSDNETVSNDGTKEDQ